MNRLLITLALLLTGCMAMPMHAARDKRGCGHMEVCHANHHHHNARIHGAENHADRPRDQSRQERHARP